ncbi:fibronectin type III domain-containing protein [Herbiconiux moechotypicola]|uniref:Fibronectin type-III domain-containing protein n=1 Tax=Herbiconiux moechotypicola TaxID=637393 RepID=A0ABP5QJ90_9MICO|nr:fibronectin type III domain-containing protein [Herbiconiux moechotypicola]MCS5730010.1 fibronectin type III domain-containing protein [Herbiconiux moechotypicola]
MRGAATVIAAAVLAGALLLPAAPALAAAGEITPEPTATSEPASTPEPSASAEPVSPEGSEPEGSEPEGSEPEPESTAPSEPVSTPDPTATPAPTATPEPIPSASPAPGENPALPAIDPTPLPASTWQATTAPTAGTVLLQSDPAGIDYGVDIAWAPSAEQSSEAVGYRVELFSGRNPDNANTLISRVEVDADTLRYRVEGVAFGSATVVARVTVLDGAAAVGDRLVSTPLTLPPSSTGVLSSVGVDAPTLSGPTADGLTVTWNAADDSASPAPAGYALRVLERRHDQLATSANSYLVGTYDVGTPVTGGDGTLSAELTGLEGSSRYLVAVVPYDVVDGVLRFRGSSATSTPPPSWAADYLAQTLGSRAPLTEFSNRPATPEATSARVVSWSGTATTGRYTGGSPVTGYVVELHAAGTGLVTSQTVTVTDAAEAPATVFRGLQPGARYSVRVAAVNADGVGELSDFSATVTTPTASDPGSRPPAYADRAAVAAAVGDGSLQEAASVTVQKGTALAVDVPWTGAQSGEAWWYGDAVFARTVTTPVSGTTSVEVDTSALAVGTQWLLLVSDDELDGRAAPTGAPPVVVRVEVTAPANSTLQLENAVLRWGLNDESNNGAYFGGCNFLSAGLTPDPGGSALFAPAQYSAKSGTVSIEKPDASGAYVPASWDTKCLDRTGTPLSSGTSTPYGGNQFVMTGGTGEVDRATGSASIRWDGDVTVVYYGGLTFWYLSDPVLTVENGVGTLTATGSGFGTDMDDQTKWQPIAPRTITLATFSGVQVGADGFTVTPDYRGVAVSLPADATPQSRTGADWGSFPQSFVDFQRATGQAAYWYSSGGQADAAKPATPFVVGYDAATFTAPAAETPAATEQAGARVPSAKLPPARVPVVVAPVTAATALASGAATAGASVVIVESASASALGETELVLLLALIAALGLIVVVVGAGGGAVVLLERRNPGR